MGTSLSRRGRDGFDGTYGRVGWGHPDDGRLVLSNRTVAVEEVRQLRRLPCASPGTLALAVWRGGASNPNVGSRRQAPTDGRPTERLRHLIRLETVRAHPNKIPSCTPPAGSPCKADGAAVHYERHRPEQTTLYAWCSNTRPVSSRMPSSRASSRTSSTPSSSAASWRMAS